MTVVALKGLFARRLRAVLTALAIVLGVAMVSGSFVLTDTISKAFDTIFTSSYSHTDAVVSGKKLVDYSNGGNATVSQALLQRIRRMPDVAAASGAEPALLLDDVFAELDRDRQERLAARLLAGGARQTFITAPREDELPGAFHLESLGVEAGRIGAGLGGGRLVA